MCVAYPESPIVNYCFGSFSRASTVFGPRLYIAFYFSRPSIVPGELETREQSQLNKLRMLSAWKLPHSAPSVSLRGTDPDRLSLF